MSLCSRIEMSIILRGMVCTPLVAQNHGRATAVRRTASLRSTMTRPCLETLHPGSVGRRAQLRCLELRRAALRLGVGEVELDLQAVRIEQEELVEALVVDLALREIDLVLGEMLDHLVQAGGAEADVVDHAGAGGGFGLLADV